MKKLLLLLSGLISVALQTSAQAPFNTRDSISVNHINASVLLHGDMWYDPIALIPKCEFPKSTGKHLAFVGSLWMSGYDNAGKLHVSAQTYRQDGIDYWPGPLNANDTLGLATSTNWARFWKIKNADLLLFRSLATHTVANTPPDILSWPATGNTYATGSAGVALNINTSMSVAPFVDINSNGIYEPLLGEYPDVKGDEALWWVFSDNGPRHNNSKGKPMGVEIHAMSYAYNRGTLIDNVVYYEYTIINKSANNYDSFRVGQFSDCDLGVFDNDFVGFDSAHRMAICYNGAANDGVNGNDSDNTYGTHPPVQGTTMILLPGDVGTSLAPAGSFISYSNDFSATGNPTADTQYNFYMRGRNKTGAMFHNTYAGYGLPPLPAGTGPVMPYFAPGDPSDTSMFSECTAGYLPGDRRSIISSSDIAFAAGSAIKVVMALVVTDTNQASCPNTNFHDITTVADTAWSVYFSQLAAAGINDNSTVAGSLHVYPNPATNQLYIDLPIAYITADSIKIYNTLGQLLNIGITTQNGKQVADISALPAGLYHLQCITPTGLQAATFIKE